MVDLPSGIQLLRLPLAGSALRWVNSYLIKGDNGYILVDCGWDMPDTLDALQAGLRDAGIGLDDVRTLVITHMHTDHYGLTGTLRRLGQFRLLMHRLDWLYLQTRAPSAAEVERHSEEWMHRNGFTDLTLSEEDLRFIESMRRYTVVEPDLLLEDGVTISSGPEEFQVIWTPGHTIGHVCLYGPRQKFLIAGDHVLDPITPNVSVWDDQDVNPLGNFVDSLRKVGLLDGDLVLPAHGEPFLGLHRRVGELLHHHTEREQGMWDLLLSGPKTAYEIAHGMPWTRRKVRFEDLELSHQRLSVTETLAHLELLSAEGRAERYEHNGVRYFRAASR